MTKTDKTWFITGAAAGFGRAFVAHAIRRGYNVVATARNPAKLADLVAEAPGRVLALTLDVDRAGDADKAVAAAVERFGRLDVVINNAGFGIVGAIEETPDSELRAVMETNFFGAMAVIKAVVPILRAQRFGAIVNNTSMGGQMTLAGFGPYAASKFALEGASEALVQEMAPFGVKVLIIEPGAFRTDFATALRHMPMLPPYDAIVGPMRKGSADLHGVQQGDPLKAAEAVEQALAADPTPLRLQLGPEAVDAIRAHAQALLADLEKWAPVGRGAVFDASEGGKVVEKWG